MTINKINKISQGNIELKKVMSEEDIKPNSIFGFTNINDGDDKNSVSEAMIITQNFINEIFNKLETTGSKEYTSSSKYSLSKLINYIQTINGIQKNNLMPQGNTELYNNRIKELHSSINLLKERIGSELNVIKDPETGLYKLSINNELFDVPERKVELVEVTTEDGIEISPQIVD